MQVGELIGPLEVGPVAHGGHCVARYDGLVVFVRHTLPGERVTARVTELSRRFARADAVEVVVAAAERVAPPCPNAGVCGGCDFQHASVGFQAELKRRVLAEQLLRLAGISWDGVIEPVPPALGSRVRMRFVTDDRGRLGLRKHRSSQVVPLPLGGCPIAHPTMPSALDEVAGAVGSETARNSPSDASGEPATARNPAPFREILGLVSEQGGRLGPADSAALVTQRVGQRSFRVAVDGFWQAHLAAPEVLSQAVLDGLRPGTGERAFDLYCGVGVFAGALVDAGVEVWGVESNRGAVALARRNVPQARFRAGSVAGAFRKLPSRADLVVLDPPRTGAGEAVIAAIANLRPRAVAYVSCDPATLARDLAVAVRLGFEVTQLRGFDLFAMTHHLEAVAILRGPERRRAGTPGE